MAFVNYYEIDENYVVFRIDWGDPIATVTEANDDGEWVFSGNNTDDEMVYQYGVTAFMDDDEASIGGNEFRIIPEAAANTALDACEPKTPDARMDFLVEAALVSDVTLHAFLGLLPEERFVGTPIPISGMLSDHQSLTGAGVHAGIVKNRT